MDHMQMWWAYLLLGLCAGTVGACLGVGGGVIMVPALAILFNFDQKVAQGTSMGAMIGIAITAFYRYWKTPEVKVEIAPVVLIGLAAIVGAVIGVRIAVMLPRATLQRIFAVVMLVAAARLFYKSLKPGTAGTPAAQAAGVVESGSPAAPPANRASTQAPEERPPK